MNTSSETIDLHRRRLVAAAITAAGAQLGVRSRAVAPGYAKTPLSNNRKPISGSSRSTRTSRSEEWWCTTQDRTGPFSSCLAFQRRLYA